jgi:hypothetical protein
LGSERGQINGENHQWKPMFTVGQLQVLLFSSLAVIDFGLIDGLVRSTVTRHAAGARFEPMTASERLCIVRLHCSRIRFYYVTSW